MTKRTLLTTTLLAGIIIAGTAITAEALEKVQTHETVTTATVPPTPEEQAQQRVAAEYLIDHVNTARLDLAINKAPDAQNEISQAKNMVTVLDNSATEYRTRTKVQAGRFTYEYNHASRDHYFPLGGGMVERKEFDTGPFWSSQEGIAVKNAEIAYITINIDTKETAEKLNEAQEALNKNELDDAGDALDDILESSIKAEQVDTLPLVKAQDNLTLARAFLQAKNYDGARFSLKHAQDGIDAMKSDDRYKSHDARIDAMSSEVKQMQDVLAKNDPTLMDKAQAKVVAWWNELKGWSNDKQKSM